MTDSAYDILQAQVERRQWREGQAALNLMAALYEGNLPQEYHRYFPKGDPKTVINMIKLAWDDLSVSAGRWPDLRGDPVNASNAEMKRIGKFEHIANSYLRNSEPTGQLFMRELAWWLVGGGRSVMVVKPDMDRKTPTFQTKDPRYVYPSGRTNSLNQYIEIYDIIMKYEIGEDEAEMMGFKVAKREGGPYDMEPAGEQGKMWVIEYIDDQYWVIATENGEVRRAKHGLGKVPGWVFQTIAPNSVAGLSTFKDQVSLMVAISRMFSGKMAMMDRMINPVYWVRGHEGAVRIGPHVLNKLGPNGEMGQIAPPATIQVDRDIQNLNQFARVLNRNPEVRQGEVSNKSQYVGAKTLEQLSESIDTVIGGFWDVIQVGLEKMFAVAFEMDEKLWPDVEKSIAGIMKGSRFNETYIPSEDIAGRRFIHVDHGFGVGGYQGFLMHLQAYDAKVMSKRRVIESQPGQGDVDAAMREIELDQMDDAGMALFQQKAAQGQLDIVLWSKLRKEMARNGKPLSEVIEKYEEEIQKQAQAAQMQQAGPQGGPGGMTAPPPEQAPPQQAPPGLPPSVLAGA